MLEDLDETIRRLPRNKEYKFLSVEEPKGYTYLDKTKGLAPICAIDRCRISTDGKGITTLVGFHKCLLRCKYCINPQTWQMNTTTKKMMPQELYEEVKKDNLYFQATGGGITFGGGEPCLYSWFIAEFREICNPQWKFNIETSLCVDRCHIEKLLHLIDFWIIDIKDMDNTIYKNYTGFANDLMISNLRFLLDNNKAHQILVRVPYIQGYNTEEDIKRSVLKLKEMGVLNIERFEYHLSEENPLVLFPERPLIGSLITEGGESAIK